ncbi:GGDEF domain-containing protein [Dactylosporangium sucinum]|uniref:GGDEF domain-containing protein n=1 Tax=Dactylosporangium sucinum TaxID=1424081 RepID=A0A917U3H9_9ACTN|nr:GGDEF domain-containing protein [Dactylosporangium sucinum]GGM55709.1 hypothetical protein GCM10007977_066750 [Dactylosporangium sucinum]
MDAALRRQTAGSGRGPVVHCIDLDGFKPINDAHGHAAGDRLLVEIARRLRATAGPGDTVARLGGDEFVVLCEETAEDAGALAERLRRVIAEPVAVGPAVCAVTASVGTASADRIGQPTADALVAAADTAMYQRKAARRAALV